MINWSDIMIHAIDNLLSFRLVTRTKERLISLHQFPFSFCPLMQSHFQIDIMCSTAACMYVWTPDVIYFSGFDFHFSISCPSPQYSILFFLPHVHSIYCVPIYFFPPLFFIFSHHRSVFKYQLLPFLFIVCL